MNSPWGQRGEICQHFGWTYDYLLRGIAWINVQLMMADAPRMNTDEMKDGKPGVQSGEKMSKDDVRDFFAKRNAALRKNKRK